MIAGIHFGVLNPTGLFLTRFSAITYYEPSKVVKLMAVILMEVSVIIYFYTLTVQQV